MTSIDEMPSSRYRETVLFEVRECAPVNDSAPSAHHPPHNGQHARRAHAGPMRDEAGPSHGKRDDADESRQHRCEQRRNHPRRRSRQRRRRAEAERQLHVASAQRARRGQVHQRYGTNSSKPPISATGTGRPPRPRPEPATAPGTVSQFGSRRSRTSIHREPDTPDDEEDTPMTSSMEPKHRRRNPTRANWG